MDYQCKPTDLVMVDILPKQDILLRSISQNASINGAENEVYFYHGDHLGSANWITDFTGTPIQYIHYAPYGELVENQYVAGYDERYKFTGKERDAETGYDYFGARFYWATIGHWLSVDPLADKYPNISPYAYCAWNPIKFIDPDGNKIVFSEKTTSEFRESFKQAVSYLQQNGLDKFVNDLENSQQTYTIDDVDLGDFTHYNIKERTIHWDPYGGVETKLGKKLSPTTVLNHELDHASQHDSNPNQFRQDANTQDAQYTNKEERRVITTSEQETARVLGEIGNTEVTRNDHKGTPYVTKSPITNEHY